MPRSLVLSIGVLFVISVLSALVGALADNPGWADAGWMVFVCSLSLAILLLVVGMMTQRRTRATS